jgi:aryl-alcohol dehydrogenase-like predicted oxidoreductase
LDNLETLALDQVPVVNLRRHPDAEVAFGEQLDAMIALRDEGLIGSVGLSNVTLDEYRSVSAKTEVACVQNAYNLADRSDQALLEACAGDGVAYVPFFPLGSAFHPENPVLTLPAVTENARRLGVTPAQVALSWLLQRSANVLLIPGTSSPVHLEENLAAGALVLDDEALAALD